MTEQEWLCCADHPREMDEFLYHRQTGRTGGLFGHMREQKWEVTPPRKWSLVACAYCRRFSGRTQWDELAPLVELAEQLDGRQEESGAGLTVSNTAYTIFYEVQQECMFGMYDNEVEANELEETWYTVCRSWCDVLRDIFGNPFRPVSVNPTWLAWNRGAVVGIARTIYDDNAFDLLPILADALKDADCDDEEILQHCRDGGPHVRGCWVVDSMLGRG